ncbi:uncharacterized protein [Watersipora subatra]|uniref:uncharacterized protein n=1 Tax=Watersipora subatra TaxID=2589382 RepID=UPI00355AEF6E
MNSEQDVNSAEHTSQAGSGHRMNSPPIFRTSDRIKKSTLLKDIPKLINDELEKIEDFLTNMHTEEEMQDFSSAIEKILEEIQEKWFKLCELTDDKERLTTLQNMFEYYGSTVDDCKRTLAERIEEASRVNSAEYDSDIERELEEAAAKFQQLMARKKARDSRSSSTNNKNNRLPKSETGSAASNAETKMNNSGSGEIQALTKALIATMKSTKRSTLEPSVFKGDPTMFKEWETDFDTYIESEGLTGLQPLRHFKRFISGKAFDAVSGYFITNTMDAYEDAGKDLRERFGKQYDAALGLRKKLEEFPKIGTRDADSMRKYANLLSHIKSAMRGCDELRLLNDRNQNEILARKLPEWMLRSWAKKVRVYVKEYSSYPTFNEFAEFVKEQAEDMEEERKISGQEASQNYQHKPDFNKRERSYAPANSMKLRSHSTGTSQISECLYCKKTHLTNECWALAKLPREPKNLFFQENGLCFGCTQRGHVSRQCPNRAFCSKTGWGKRHPTVLHIDFSTTSKHWRNQEQAAVPKPPSERSSTTSMPSTNIQPGKEPSAELKRITSKKTGTTGNSLSMILPVHITTDKSPAKTLLVYALLDSGSDHSYINTDLAKYLQPDYTRELVTVETLTGESTKWVTLYQDIRIQGYEQADFTHLDAYGWKDIACNRDHIPCRNNVAKLSHLKEFASKLPPLMDIPIGLLIGANCPEAFAPLEALVQVKGLPYARKSMLGWTVFGADNRRQGDRRLITHRTCIKLDDHVLISQEDIKFLNIMEQTTEVLPSGSYQMALPFRQRPHLPDNKRQAEQRLTSLFKRFESDSEFKLQYVQFMQEMFSGGHAEEATNIVPQKGCVWYIPHFAVKHQKKGKLCVVFDCAATYSGTSVNQHLLQGPDLTNSMLGISCRFRKGKIAIACDIKKMFFNFHVTPSDRDYLRFLWKTTEGEVKEYRMTKHLFGATSSPAVATYGLRTLADDHAGEYPKAAEFIRRDFCVDDGITSVNTTEEAQQLIEDARALCATGNLRLHKFISNDSSVSSSIPESERAVDLFADYLSPQPPFTHQGRNILQKVNKTSVDWDEPLNEEMNQLWNRWATQLSQLQLEIPRCLDGLQTQCVYELHTFSDASLEGIGACSYLRSIDNLGNVCTNLLLAKAKVVPSKGVTTIPRLKLQGAFLATQLNKTLQKELHMDISKSFFWCDLTIVLGYICNDRRKFHTFVANRVYGIRQASNPEQWHHVPGAENPADIASRGMEAEKLKRTMWYTGPKFLRSQPELQHRLQLDMSTRREVSEDDPEVKKVQVVRATEISTLIDMYNKLKKYSTLKGLLGAFAYLLQMAKNKSLKIPLTRPSIENIEAAKRLVMKITQTKYFQEEIRVLKKGNQVMKTSSLLRLSPYLDQHGLIRIGGRARNYLSLTELEKHPIILPKNSHSSKLFISYYHEISHHMGPSYTLTSMRQNGLWLISGIRTVKKQLGQCMPCRKMKRRPMRQQMGELPQDRTSCPPPFSHTGMDCFGPYAIKEGRKEMKKYGLVFTCSVIKLYSDNGTNFVGAKNLLDAEAKRCLCDRGIEFVFNSPTASHQGGVWERQIRTIRAVLNDILRQSSRLDSTSLRTAFYEVAAIVNNRPLGAINISNHEETPVTPNMILTERKEPTAPPPGDFDEAIYCHARWKRVQWVAQEFLRKWKLEYLDNITRRQTWTKVEDNLKVRDVVLIVESNEPRNMWQIGRVEDVFPGKDGLVRKVTVRLGNCNLDKKGRKMAEPTYLQRPIQKLVKLLEDI